MLDRYFSKALLVHTLCTLSPLFDTLQTLFAWILTLLPSCMIPALSCSFFAGDVEGFDTLQSNLFLTIFTRLSGVILFWSYLFWSGIPWDCTVFPGGIFYKTWLLVPLYYSVLLISQTCSQLHVILSSPLTLLYNSSNFWHSSFYRGFVPYFALRLKSGIYTHFFNRLFYAVKYNCYHIYSSIHHTFYVVCCFFTST